MKQAVDELWSVATGVPYVDAQTLACAVESAAESSEPFDYRTRLLIRDSLSALEAHWGRTRFDRWFGLLPSRERIEEATRPETFDPDPNEIGFPSLKRRVMDATKIEDALAFFEQLSEHVRKPTRLNVGGSLALILRGLLSRQTEDADVVNEVPAELRNQHDVLNKLAERYGLSLTHFQSHYLPKGWEGRLRSLNTWGELEVYLVDPYDVMVSKLCSKRDKDLDDLRAMKPQIDRDKLKDRLIDSGQALVAEERLREAARKNWRLLFAESLPELR